MPNPENSNGSPIGQISRSYESAKQAQSEYENETRRIQNEFKATRREYEDLRFQARARAAKHAANLGLIYNPVENTYARALVPDDLPPVPQVPDAVFETEALEGETVPEAESPGMAEAARYEALPVTSVMTTELSTVEASAFPNEGASSVPARPKRPEPPTPAMPPMPPKPDQAWKRNSQIKSGFLWGGSIVVGLFVGYGILKITQIPYERPGQEYILYTALALGVAAIAGIKLTLDAMWSLLGRDRTLGRTNWPTVAVVALLTIGLISAEAFLGGTAIQSYLQALSATGTTDRSLWLCVLVATAITTPTLIYSAVVGYQNGRYSVTEAEMLARHYDIEREHHARVEAIREAEYRADLKEREEELQKLEAAERKRLELEARQQQEASEDRERERQRALSLREAQDARNAELLEQQHEIRKEMLVRWQDRLKAVPTVHEGAKEALGERLDEYANYRNLPDFRAMLESINLVEVLTEEIQRLKKESDHIAISRGYAKKSALI